MMRKNETLGYSNSKSANAFRDVAVLVIRIGVFFRINEKDGECRRSTPSWFTPFDGWDKGRKNEEYGRKHIFIQGCASWNYCWKESLMKNSDTARQIPLTSFANASLIDLVCRLTLASLNNLITTDDWLTMRFWRHCPEPFRILIISADIQKKCSINYLSRVQPWGSQFRTVK